MGGAGPASGVALATASDTEWNIVISGNGDHDPTNESDMFGSTGDGGRVGWVGWYAAWVGTLGMTAVATAQEAFDGEPIPYWKAALNHFVITFEERMPKA